MKLDEIDQGYLLFCLKDGYTVYIYSDIVWNNQPVVSINPYYHSIFHKLAFIIKPKNK